MASRAAGSITLRLSHTELTAPLVRLSDVLTEHLNDEEAKILPLVREHVTVAEWEELGRESFAKFPRSARPIMMRLLMEDATPGDRALFRSKAPLPARLSWPTVGERSYRRYIGRVRGYAPRCRPPDRPIRHLAHDRLPTANSSDSTHWDLGAVPPPT